MKTSVGGKKKRKRIKIDLFNLRYICVCGSVGERGVRVCLPQRSNNSLARVNQSVANTGAHTGAHTGARVFVGKSQTGFINFCHNSSGLLKFLSCFWSTGIKTVRHQTKAKLTGYQASDMFPKNLFPSGSIEDFISSLSY